MTNRLNYLLAIILVSLMLPSSMAQKPNTYSAPGSTSAELGEVLAHGVQTILLKRGKGATSLFQPQVLVARLTLSGGRSATVNGASAVSGATVLSGATIETPEQVSATLDLGALGNVDLSPNSAVQLDFNDSGTVRAKILRGCIRVKKKGPGEAEIYTVEGASEKTNSTHKAMGFCYLDGKLNPFGAAAGSVRRKPKFPWCMFVLKC